MQSTIVTQPPLRAATVQHTGPYDQIGAAFEELSVAAAAANLGGPGAMLVGIYHDDPATALARALRSEAGLVVSDGVTIPPSLKETLIPGGRYLQGRHLGSYEGLPRAWAELMEKGLAEHGVTRGTGAGYELYLNTPMTAETDDLITEIYIPVS